MSQYLLSMDLEICKAWEGWATIFIFQLLWFYDQHNSMRQPSQLRQPHLRLRLRHHAG